MLGTSQVWPTLNPMLLTTVPPKVQMRQYQVVGEESEIDLHFAEEETQAQKC